MRSVKDASGGGGPGSGGKPGSGGEPGTPDGEKGQAAGQSPREGNGRRGGFPLQGPPTPSRELPIEEHAAGAVFYEGRWIEGAIAQRRQELMARRAYAEASHYARETYGTSATLVPFEDRRTTVVVLDDPHSYLVSSLLLKQMDRDGVAVSWEVERSKAGEWRVVSPK